MRTRTPLLLAGAVLALAGCTQGYPREDLAVEGRPSARQLTAWINRAIHANESDAQRIALEGSCRVAVRWKGEDAATVYRLGALRVIARSQATDSASPNYIVKIARQPQPRADRPVLLSTPYWRDFTLVRSGLHHLRSLCEVARRKADGAGVASP